MQDEHFMKLRSEAHRLRVMHLREGVCAIGPAYEGASSPHALPASCRERLANLLGWAIPAGILAGTAAAAIAAAATMPPAPRQATYHPTVASFSLPYAA
jgi:hypothetical protein